jgi:hypothetical protein
MADERYFKEPRFLQFPRHRAGYSDRTAWVMSVLADLAYSAPGPAMDAALAEVGFTFQKSFEARFFDKYDTQGILVHGPDYAVLAFRGTVATDIANWVTDLNFRARKIEGGLEVHDGFWTAFDPLRQPLQDELSALGKPFYIAGHSLGGALAVLATFSFHPLFPDLIEACYTFGCPKVGNLAFLESLYKVPVYQVIHHSDLVPHVPPRLLSGFHDSGDIRHLLDGGVEVRGVKGWATGAEWFLRILVNWVLGMATSLFGRVPVLRGAVRRVVGPQVVIEDHSIARYSDCLLQIARDRNPA